jgi:two-component system, OmpR family, KDP operon response regulator KdpE
MRNDTGLQTDLLRSGLKNHVLIVDPDPAIHRLVRVGLSRLPFDLTETANAQQALEACVRQQPDLALVELHLPDRDGIDLMSDLQALHPTPVLILSAMDDERCKIQALNAGADDYIVKPFNLDELVARMHVSLRRRRTVNGLKTFVSGGLQVDLVRRLVSVEGRFVNLTPTEYALLRLVIVHGGEPVTHRQLWEAIRGPDAAFEAHRVRVHMSNLRRKLEPDPAHPQYIITEVGTGYRLRVTSLS